MVDCEEAPAAPAGAFPAPDRPSYKPEVMAKVKDLTERQVEEDPILRCLSPGVPRIGPPDKIVQQENQIVFLYDDVNGNFFRVIPTDGRSQHLARRKQLGGRRREWRWRWVEHGRARIFRIST